MDISLKIECFEYFLYNIIKWYKKCYNGHSLDITRLKALKLLFLTSAIKTEDGGDLLDIFNNFFAMQHGPVESDIYNAINGSQLVHYQFGGTKVSVINEENVVNGISDDIRRRIDASLWALYGRNSQLIRLTSFQLVDITHKWSCWQKSMEVAKILGKGSYLMDIESIRNSNQIFE